MLIKDDVVHGLGKVNVHLVEQSGGISRRLTAESFSVLGHSENAVHLVAVNFGNLVFGHVFNIVVVLYQGISVDSLLVSSLEATREDSGVFFVEQNVDA